MSRPHVGKAGAQIQVLFSTQKDVPDTRLQNKAIVLAGCASVRASGMARMETLERAFISNLQMSVLKYQPHVERNPCAAAVISISIVANKR
jgi:uncharacterized heparinase superfamily protein